jgi:hypothetical protein
MGGVAGHMDHLYDNPNLTFGKMKEIMDAASNAELNTEEKVDGQNLFLSYSADEGKAKGARNKGNLREGGLDATGLAQKFAGRGSLEKAFTTGFSAFEQAVKALSEEEKKRIFGPDTNIWYNSEIMDPGAKNVINYDGKTLKIHNVGHFVFDRDTGEQSSIPKGTLEVLDNALERMQDSLSKHEFSLVRKAVIQMKKLENDEALSKAKSRIDAAIGAENISTRSTVGDYMFSRLMTGMDTELSRDLKEEITKYLLELPGNIGLRQLKKGLPPEDLGDLQSIIASRKMLLKEAIWPIELAVHDFTVEILKGLESRFIVDTGAEVDRLRAELAQAVRELTDGGAEDPAAMEIMQRQLNKIKDMGNITTPVEALVFDYDGHTYKFAGNFAPLNQILGMFRYPKGGKKLAQENLALGGTVITEKEGKRVALLPGGFKPPHAGHYELAKHLASLPDVDEVVVIVGKNSRFDEKNKIEITADQSKTLWDIYTANNENIKTRIQTGKTPVADVYDLIADTNSFSEGDTVILGKSDKDEGDTRFSRAQSYAERNNPGVNVEEKIMPAFGGKGMGGTALRDLIAANKKETFLSKLPQHLNQTKQEEVWEIVSPFSNETLNRLIDTHIDEISAMSAGAVEGTSGGFGPPNRYSSYRRTKKPKVKRGKRQRRR